MKVVGLLCASSLVLVLVQGCSGNPGASTASLDANPQRPVPLGEWCESLMHANCERVGACLGSSAAADGCNETGATSCLAGRDPSTPSGHVASDLSGCLRTVTSLSCDGYLVTFASHTECQASAPLQ